MSNVVDQFKIAQMIAELNPQQREAAIHIDGRYLVIAGAGSGKTKTLTTRIANMLGMGIKPGSIFCATFTNKASKEMKERLANAVGQENADFVWMGTFHSLCVRILRKHGHLLGYGQKDNRCNFQIYDGYDSYKMIERIFKIMNLDDKYHPKVASSYIDTAKNNLWTPEYCMYQVADTPANEVFSLVYNRYQSMLKEANAMDFGDLIMNVVLLLTDHEQARDYWQAKFHYVMCDEFQDTNPAQFELLTKLAEPHYNIFAVGDHDQSIYRFRGSDINIILGFEKYFSPCTILKLEENYRSTQNVVHAGNYLIGHNTKAYDKVLRANKEQGPPIEIIETTNEYTEAAFVAAKIKQMVMQGNRSFGDFAILYRNGFQSSAFEQLFHHNMIPYQIVGGTAFFEREEVKDITCYLRIIHNRKDDVAMLRMMNKPARGIGDTSKKEIEVYANSHKVSVFRALKRVEDIPTIKKAARGKIETFLHTLDHLEGELGKGRTMQGFVKYVMDQTGLMKHYNERANKDKKEAERIDNLEEFVRIVSTFESEHPDKTIEDFLMEMSLVSDYGEESKGEKNVVRLMTMHASKGLEFPVVFNVGWNESVFPSWRSQGPTEVEEERRLAYVAVTRAEYQVFISYVTQRQSPNGKGVQTFQPSRFVAELPEEIVKKTKIGGDS